MNEEIEKEGSGLLSKGIPSVYSLPPTNGGSRPMVEPGLSSPPDLPSESPPPQRLVSGNVLAA